MRKEKEKETRMLNERGKDAGREGGARPLDPVTECDTMVVTATPTVDSSQLPRKKTSK
jgi:hypothetical protein